MEAGSTQARGGNGGRVLGGVRCVSCTEVASLAMRGLAHVVLRGLWREHRPYPPRGTAIAPAEATAVSASLSAAVVGLVAATAARRLDRASVAVVASRSRTRPSRPLVRAQVASMAAVVLSPTATEVLSPQERSLALLLPRGEVSPAHYFLSNISSQLLLIVIDSYHLLFIIIN